MINSIPLDFFISDYRHIDSAVQFFDSHNGLENNLTFLTAVWEAYSPQQVFFDLDSIAHDRKIPITWVINKWGQDDPAWQRLKNPVVFIDFFLWRVYNELFVKQKNKVNTCWDRTSDQYLFFTGKPDKLQRILLLYLLQSQNLLDQCTYSFFMNPGMEKNSRKCLPFLSNLEFNEFITIHQKNPDNISIREQTVSLHYGGIPYDHTLYSNIKFRLVSETEMERRPPWITEKTWLTIANKVPFIIAGDLHSCKYLNKQGIQTFDNLFNVPSYDNISDVYARLSLIVEHVKLWLNNQFICDYNTINSQVEDNFNQFVQLALAEKQKFELATGQEIDSVINTIDDISGF
jgi:hypothetical protein